MQKTLLTCFCLLLSIVMQAATIDVKGVVIRAARASSARRHRGCEK